MARIYLDHAATTPLRPEAKAAMEEGYRLWANPSSPHAEGRRARAALEEARARVKAALAWDGEVIFTSGASEALAIGLGRARIGGKAVDRRIVSSVEHDAVFRAAPDAQIVIIDGSHGGAGRVAAERFAEIDRDALADKLAMPGKPIVAIQHVNSETGVIQPVEALAAQVREAGGLLLSDCSQSAGRLVLPGADMLVLSAHKLGGPIGIGALLVRDFTMLEPTGGHERGYRTGTENLPAVLGLAAALEAGGLEAWPLAEADMADFKERLRHPAHEPMHDPADPILPRATQRAPYILALTHSTMSAQALLIRLDALGIAVSAGSACSSGSLKPSRVLAAFGIDEATAQRTIRVSLGWTTTPADLDAFLEAWSSLAPVKIA